MLALIIIRIFAILAVLIVGAVCSLALYQWAESHSHKDSVLPSIKR